MKVLFFFKGGAKEEYAIAEHQIQLQISSKEDGSIVGVLELVNMMKTNKMKFILWLPTVKPENLYCIEVTNDVHTSIDDVVFQLPTVGVTNFNYNLTTSGTRVRYEFTFASPEEFASTLQQALDQWNNDFRTKPQQGI